MLKTEKHRRLAILGLSLFTLWLLACTCAADTSEAKVPAAGLTTWKIVGGIVIGLELLAFGYGVGKFTGGGCAGVISILVTAAVVGLLCWSKVGELFYVTFRWFMGWETLGPISHVIFTLVLGLAGPLVSLQYYLLGGFIYNDITIMQYALLPSMISAAITSVGIMVWEK